MGGNNSTLNPSGAEAFPASVRPILIRRLEEFKKRRNVNGGTLRGGGGGGEGAISKKQLLKDDGGVAAEEQDENTEPSHSHHENEPVVHVEKLSKVVPLPVSDCRIEEKHKEHKDHNQEKVKDVKPQTENKHEDANAKHDDDDDDDYDEIGRLIGPGSPSFKIYCTEAENKKEEQERVKQTVAIMHQKTPSADSDESDDASNEPIEIMESTSKRKGHKMKKFMMMKKNLLNVKNLHIKHRMNPMFSCSGNDRKSRLSLN